MIVPQKYIRTIVHDMPSVYLDNYIQFGYGDEFELNRWLELKKDKSYPLVWLLPSEDMHENYGRELRKRCEFIIATRETRQDLFNSDREDLSFDKILYPVTENLIQGLKGSKISRVIGKNWKTKEYPNYSQSNKSKTIDLWDAIRLDIEVVFHNCVECFKPIDYGC